MRIIYFSCCLPESLKYDWVISDSIIDKFLINEIRTCSIVDHAMNSLGKTRFFLRPLFRFVRMSSLRFSTLSLSAKSVKGDGDLLLVRLLLLGQNY